MLNMYFTVLNCRAGFPEVAAIKLVPFRVLGTIEDAVSKCVEEFEQFANRYSGTAPFSENKEELIALARQISHPDDVVSKSIAGRRDDGFLVQRVLVVSVRSGEDIPTRRY